MTATCYTQQAKRTGQIISHFREFIKLNSSKRRAPIIAQYQTPGAELSSTQAGTFLDLKRKVARVLLVVDFLLPSHARCGHEAAPAGARMPSSA